MMRRHREATFLGKVGSESNKRLPRALSCAGLLPALRTRPGAAVRTRGACTRSSTPESTFRIKP